MFCLHATLKLLVYIQPCFIQLGYKLNTKKSEKCSEMIQCRVKAPVISEPNVPTVHTSEIYRPPWSVTSVTVIPIQNKTLFVTPPWLKGFLYMPHAAYEKKL